MVLYVGHCHVQSNLDTRSLRGPGRSLATSSTYQPLLLPSLLLNGFHISVSQSPGDRIQSGLGFYHRGLKVILLTGELIVAEGGGVLGRGAIWSWVSCPSRLPTSSLELQTKSFLCLAGRVLPTSTEAVLSSQGKLGTFSLSFKQANLHDSRYCL